jgi:AraC family transcriptional regulator
MWEGGSLWLFDVPRLEGDENQRNDMHAHHALQLTFALDGEFNLHFADRVVPGPAAIVAADAEHAFEASGVVALMFIEPESRAGRALTARFLSDAPGAALPAQPFEDALARMLNAFRQSTDNKATLAKIGQALTDRLADVGAAQEPDPRVREMMAWANDNLDRPIGIAEVAQEVKLSTSRASHLFVEHTGLQFRTYLIWLRLQRAVDAYASGASLTEAAHEAGFADSAHLSRNFRRMFGLPAAALELR